MAEKKLYTFGKPVDLPKSDSWKPKKGETRLFQLKRMVAGKFGMSYLVYDIDNGKEIFLPHHVMLMRRLDTANLHPNDVFQIKCVQEGSENPGDTYDYEVRLAKK